MSADEAPRSERAVAYSGLAGVSPYVGSYGVPAVSTYGAHPVVGSYAYGHGYPYTGYSGYYGNGLNYGLGYSGYNSKHNFLIIIFNGEQLPQQQKR